MHAHHNPSEEENQLRMDFIQSLEKMKSEGVELVEINFSTLNSFGMYGSLELDELFTALYKTRTEKNERIDKREYKAALELEKVEKAIRAEINKEICIQLYKREATFYSLGAERLGFIFTGNEKFDILLYDALHLVHRKITVHHKQLLSKNVTKLKKEKIETMKKDERRFRNAA